MLHRFRAIVLCLPFIWAADANHRSAAQAVQLDEILVNGTGKSDSTANPAIGPIDGYVARESATGTKTATPLIETPGSVAVVGAQQIRDLNQQTVTEALTYVSGVRADTFGADPRLDWFLIRGFAAQISGYYLDGLQLFSPDFAAFQVEPFGLERLEVLKGPASVLYGGSNTGGILNAVSKRPTVKEHGYLETGIDNFGNKYGAFDFSGPVSKKPDNQFYYRLEGLARGGDTQVQFLPRDRLWIAPSLTWAPDAQTNVTLLGQYQKDRSRSQNFLPYVGTVTTAPYGRIPTSLYIGDPGFDKFQRNQALIGYSAEHKFNENLAVRQNLRFADIRYDLRYLYGQGYDGDPADGNISRANFVSSPHLTQFAVDNQVEGRFRTGPLAHTALFGIDYKRVYFADGQGFETGPDFNVFAPNYFIGLAPTTQRYALYRQTQDQFAPYLQDQIKLDRFTLVLSGRHDMLDTGYTDRLDPTNSTTGSTAATTGRAGLIYTSDVGIAPYATVATSFDPQIGINTTSGQVFKPLTGQLKEVGVKYQPKGVNFSFDAALFDLTQQNVLTVDPTNVLNSVQTGEQRSRGFELEAQASLTDGLKLLASYTGYRLKITKDGNPDIVGKTPTGIPQNFGALFVDYTLQTGVLKGFGAGAGPRYVGASFADNINTFAVPSYVLADASVHFERENWRAAINVRNVFDKTYVASCALFTSCYYGFRRTALFSLAYRW